MTGEIGILNVGCGDTKEPHDYPDGTTEFTHVRYRHKPEWGKGEEVCVEIGSHVTPDLAELLILLREHALATT